MATRNKKPATKSRISAEERRTSIVDAALPLFVEQGFQGVTTKMIAKVAGVSEALLYQHFPSKDAIYEAVQVHFCSAPQSFRKAFEAVEPSTAKFVTIIFTMAKMMIEKPKDIGVADVFPRLMMHSLMEDGEFAKQFLTRNLVKEFPRIAECLEAARRSGDLVDDNLPDEMRFWLTHHAIVGMHMMTLPEKQPLDYKMSKTKLIDAVVRYVLRGAGLKPAAIDRHYDFKKLDRQVQTIVDAIAKGQLA